MEIKRSDILIRKEIEDGGEAVVYLASYLLRASVKWPLVRGYEKDAEHMKNETVSWLEDQIYWHIRDEVSKLVAVTEESIKSSKSAKKEDHIKEMLYRRERLDKLLKFQDD